MEFDVLGVGAWGSSFRNWQELKSLLESKQENIHEEKGPKPEVIPANERRRAPLPVKLAVETSWQAVQDSPFEAADLASVFVSGIGDTQLTDYMCKTLATEQKALSPTKFHNSVHNAAAGYWTISTNCMQAANSVAGFQQSVGLTLLEALIQSQSDEKPVLITFYDAPSSQVLLELLDNDTAFSASIVIAPSSLKLNKGESKKLSINLANNSLQPETWKSGVASLDHCFDVNPAAKILPVLALLTADSDTLPQHVNLTVSPQSYLQVTACSVQQSI